MIERARLRDEPIEPSAREPTSDHAGTSDAQLFMLRLLDEHPNLSQRELAHRLGVSLGKSHYLLRALLSKGWVKVGNFRRSDNKAAYAYLLTPSGVREKAALTRDFLARKEVEFGRLQELIATLRREVQPEKES
jgi:EPS-associated MarR family transcriptional regulator